MSVSEAFRPYRGSDRRRACPVAGIANALALFDRRDDATGTGTHQG